MGIINVLGLISNAIGYWGFADEMFPVREDGHSTFKVYVAIDGTGPPGPGDTGECCMENAGGSIRYGKVFDKFGVDIGHGGMFPALKSGSSETITMWQSVPERAPWAMLVAGKDAVCIAAIGATLIDGSNWGWVGDWGQLCGIPWYYSGIKGGIQWNGTSPYCTWIDGDHSNGLSAGGIAIYWPGFTDAVLPIDSGKGKCDTAFKAFDKEGGKSVINKPKSARAAGAGNNMTERRGDRRLVVSTADAHSAEALCRDPMSRGPDFVSLAEQAHCDMQTREVLPLCGDGLAASCFDLEAAAAAARVRAEASGGGGGDAGDLARHIIYW